MSSEPSLHSVRVTFAPKGSLDGEDELEILESGEGPPDLSLLDPAELERRFPQPILYARQSVLLAEAYRAWTGATRQETVDYLARLLLSPKDPSFSRACLRELGMTTGIAGVYPLEVIEHVVFAFPSHLPKVGFGWVFEREDPLASLSTDTDGPLFLKLVESIKVRGFGLRSGAPGYRFEPGRDPGDYELRIHSSGEFSVLVAGVTRAGYTLIDRFSVSVRSGREDLGRTAAAEPERHASRIELWPVPVVEVESLAGEIAERSSMRRGRVTVRDLARSTPKLEVGPKASGLVAPELPVSLPEIAAIELRAAAPWPTSSAHKKMSYAPTESSAEPPPKVTQVTGHKRPAQKTQAAPALAVETGSSRPMRAAQSEANQGVGGIQPPSDPAPTIAPREATLPVGGAPTIAPSEARLPVGGIHSRRAPRIHFRSIEALPDSAVSGEVPTPRADAPPASERRAPRPGGPRPPSGDESSAREPLTGRPAESAAPTAGKPKLEPSSSSPSKRAAKSPEPAGAPARAPVKALAKVVPRVSLLDDDETQGPAVARALSPKVESPKRADPRPRQTMDDDTEVSG